MNIVIRYAICDDEPALVEHISDVSESLLKDDHLVYELKKYSNSHEFYLDIHDGVRFDIVLLDIEMPEHSGLEIAKLLKEKQPECLVIFLTSFKEYAVDAFELEIFRYIPKDQLELRFGKYFMEAVNLIRELDEKAYIVEGINSAEKLPFKKAVLANMPLMINFYKTKERMKKLGGACFAFAYGELDPSFKYTPFLRSFEESRLEILKKTGHTIAFTPEECELFADLLFS